LLDYAPKALMGDNVVCISCQDGTGGEEVALRVAERLRFPLIDEEIVARAALEAGVDQEVVADVERRKSALVRLVEGFVSGGLGMGYMAAPVSVAAPPHSSGQAQPASEELRALIRSVIEETAAKGSAVIVAHAASLALAGRDDVLRVLVTASPTARAKRLADALGTDEKQAARTIKRSDAARADYIKRFYGESAELPTHYDLVINTDRITPEQAVLLIAQATGRVEAPK
jgi:Cytidylate kinase-like family